ncbi:hypothetical protein P4O66_020023, partial [Electrophorus voltai]
EKRIARVPYQWYLMQRDKQLSGTGKYYESKVNAICAGGLENIN